MSHQQCLNCLGLTLFNAARCLAFWYSEPCKRITFADKLLACLDGRVPSIAFGVLLGVFWMLYWGTLKCEMWMVGLDDLRGLFQSWWFYDKIKTYWKSLSISLLISIQTSNDKLCMCSTLESVNYGKIDMQNIPNCFNNNFSVKKFRADKHYTNKYGTQASMKFCVLYIQLSVCVLSDWWLLRGQRWSKNEKKTKTGKEFWKKL